MRIYRLLLAASFLAAGSVSALDHVGTSAAAHMELKDDSGVIVCFAYDTDPEAEPVASSCPEGTFTEQLFDVTWSQLSDVSVDVGGVTGVCPPAVVEVWETFSNPPYVLVDSEPGDLGGGFSTYEAPDDFGGRVTLSIRLGGIFNGEVGYRPPRAVVTSSGFGSFEGRIDTTSMLLTNAEADACSVMMGFI